ncbi:MAG: orotate phosphoribosyltransferase [Candidatus Eisenbacteria sp.]|nr:orotate phosphoribosyltransferase [Candidatus Eisenbacteria bacterium]
MGNTRARLLHVLRERSLFWGEFQLSAGGTSKYYIDGKRTLMDPEGALLIAQHLFEMIRNTGANAVGGPSIGADFIVPVVAAWSFQQGCPLDAFVVRKEPKKHGQRKLIEGNLPDDASAILVDDVITTGGSVIRAIHAVEEEGGKVLKVLCLVDRREGGDENLAAEGIPLEAIFTIDEVLGISG